VAQASASEQSRAFVSSLIRFSSTFTHSANGELFLSVSVPMSVRVFLRRKVLTPAFRTDRALDELARVRRPEIQADFAALLCLRLILVLGIRLAHLLLCRRPPRGPDGRRGADGQRRSSEQ